MDQQQQVSGCYGGGQGPSGFPLQPPLQFGAAPRPPWLVEGDRANEEEEGGVYAPSPNGYGSNGDGSVMEVLGSEALRDGQGPYALPLHTATFNESPDTSYNQYGTYGNDRWGPLLEQQQQQVDLPASLSLHPVAASALRQRLLEAQRRSPNGQLDPLTTALLCRQQQEAEGQPRSPLSPHTLQRCLAALAAGEPFTLTPEAVLAPAPLALAWHTPGQLQDSRVEVLDDDEDAECGGGQAGRQVGRHGQRVKRSRDGSFLGEVLDTNPNSVNGANGGHRFRYGYQGVGASGNDFNAEPPLRRPRAASQFDSVVVVPQGPALQGAAEVDGNSQERYQTTRMPWRGTRANTDARKRGRDEPFPGSPPQRADEG